MDEAINPGRGELICVHRVLLTSLGSGWLCVPHGFTVHYYSSPGAGWKGPGTPGCPRALCCQTLLRLLLQSWLCSRAPHMGEAAFGFQSLKQAPHREGLVAESELHYQHKTQERVPSEPPGRAQLQHRDHSCACWRSEPIRAVSPSLALCCRKPSSITQQLHNYNMDNRFRSCCLSRFPPDLLIT